MSAYTVPDDTVGDDTLKNNIATYLSNYRMMNDYISVGSAKVLDLRFELDIVLENSSSQGKVIGNVINKVGEYFNIDRIEMGQDLPLGKLRGLIMKQSGIVNIVNIS